MLKPLQVLNRTFAVYFRLPPSCISLKTPVTSHGSPSISQMRSTLTMSAGPCPTQTQGIPGHEVCRRALSNVMKREGSVSLRKGRAFPASCFKSRRFHLKTLKSWAKSRELSSLPVASWIDLINSRSRSLCICFASKLPE